MGPPEERRRPDHDELAVLEYALIERCEVWVHHLPMRIISHRGYARDAVVETRLGSGAGAQGCAIGVSHQGQLLGCWTTKDSNSSL